MAPTASASYSGSTISSSTDTLARMGRSDLLHRRMRPLPRFALCWLASTSLIGTLSLSGQTTADDFYQRAVADHNRGELDLALTDYGRAIELAPNSPTAYFYRASIRQSKNDLDGSIADYSRVIELVPGYSRAYAERGTVKKLKGDFAAALADCDRAIALAPKSAYDYARRGWVKTSEDVDGAIADYPNSPDLCRHGPV